MLDIITIFLATKLHVVIILIVLVAIVFASGFARLRTLVLSAVALPIIFVSSRIASYFFENPRPFFEHDFVPLVAHAADNGFPSDHALLVFALASVTFTFNRPVGIGLFILSTLVGVGRVLVGVHHTIDIFGSVIITVSIVCISQIVIKLITDTK